MKNVGVALFSSALILSAGAVMADAEPKAGQVVAQPIAWQEYSNDKVGFKIVLPAKPHVEEAVGDTSDELAVQHSLNLSAKDEMGASIQLFAVSYSFEIPDDSSLENETREVIVKSMAGHGKIVKDSKFDVNGLRGHQVVMEEDHGDVTTVMEFRVVAKGKTMYQMYISGVKGKHYDEVSKQAVASFKLTKPKS